LPKFLDDPFKKVSYSFRIEERLLENVKKFANATGRRLPETFNYLIRESLKDCNLDNTYLNDLEGIIINVTYISPATNEFGDFIGFAIQRGSTNYLNLDNEGLLYEVKKIPNNLDVWHDKGGYYSQDQNLLHEGLSVLIVPEMIYKNPYFEYNTSYLHDCLKFIYFSVDMLGNIQVTNISYKEAFRKLKEAGNNETLYNFKNIHKTFWDFCEDFILEYEKDPEPLGHDYNNILYTHLLEFANKNNDVNINSLEDMKPPLNIDKIKINTNYETPEKDLNKIIEDLQAQIDQKDEAIKEYEEMTRDLENRYNDIDNRLKELESKKEKPKKVKRVPRPQKVNNDWLLIIYTMII